MTPDRLLDHFDRVAEAPASVPQLRLFILDLAVRGKLVEPMANDDSAADLVKRVHSGRSLLANQLGRRREALPAIRPGEVPFAVPEGWGLVRLGDALALVNGRAFKPSEWSASGVPIIRIQNLNDRNAPFNFCTLSVPEKFHVKSGDFLISWSGTPGTSFGAHIWNRGPAILNQHIFRAELPGNAFAPRFLKLAINARLLELIGQAQGGVGLQHITKPKLESLPLTLPPLAEQHRIVAKVDELMALCDRLDAAQAERERRRDRLAAASLHRLNNGADARAFREHARFHLTHLPRLTTRPEHIQQLRHAILNLAVRGKLVAQDPGDEPAVHLLTRIKTERVVLGADGTITRQEPILPSKRELPFQLPTGWTLARVQDVVESVADGDHQPPPKADSGIPFLVIGNVRSRSISFGECRYVSEQYYNSLNEIRRPGKGDILYTLVGSFGIPVVVRDSRPFCVQRHIGILRPSKHMNVEFLARVLDSRFVFDQASLCATGIAQKTVPLSGLRTIQVPLPPVTEQHRIAAKLDELMALCDQLEAQLATAQSESRRLLEAVLHEALQERSLPTPSESGTANRPPALAAPAGQQEIE